MGYRGKVGERERARDLRAAGWTYAEICAELGVSRSSVSLWVRDVPIDDHLWAKRAGANKRRGAEARRLTFERKRREQRERALDAARIRLGELSNDQFFVAGIALYAGEGGKTPGAVRFANSDPRMIALFLSWLRRFFAIDESRLRLHLYLHEGLDLDAAMKFWSDVTGIPDTQFGKPYRAVPDPSIRRAKHPMGCPGVAYSCTATHRAIMGLVNALLTWDPLPG